MRNLYIIMILIDIMCSNQEIPKLNTWAGYGRG